MVRSTRQSIGLSGNGTLGRRGEAFLYLVFTCSRSRRRLLTHAGDARAQEKNSTAPVSTVYIAPEILMSTLSSSSLSTELPVRIPAIVNSTFLRATAFTIGVAGHDRGRVEERLAREP